MRGDVKSSVLELLATGPADSTAIGATIQRTKRQTAAVLSWMRVRGYIRRIKDGVPGRFGAVPSVWAACGQGVRS